MGGFARVVLIAGALAATSGVGFFVIRRHVVLVPCVRVTVETKSATNAVCHVAWTTSESRAFVPNHSLNAPFRREKGRFASTCPFALG